MKTVRYFLPEIVIVALAMISPSGLAAALSATWTYLAEHLSWSAAELSDQERGVRVVFAGGFYHP
jgi:hypothetical protein